jgi:RNA polymerase sigma-70 factor (sigma-E family)
MDDPSQPDETVDEFCRRMYPRLVRTLTIHTGSREVSEDLAQESLARVWQQWSRVKSYESPDRFALRCAFNLSSSSFRRRAAERRAIARHGLPASSTAAQSADDIAVHDALLQLSDRHRCVVVCRYFLGMSVEETSQTLGIPVGTVKSQCSKAIDRLRALLADSPSIAIPNLTLEGLPHAGA